MVTGRGPRGREESKCHGYLQGGQEGGSRELQTGQPHLDSWEGEGATHPGNPFLTYEGQEGDRE